METVKAWRGEAVGGMNQVPSTASAGHVASASAPLAPPPAVVGIGRADASSAAAVSPSAPPLVLILDELVGTVGGVRGALLASVDGFAIARSSSMPKSAAHAAMLAAGMGLAHQLADMGGGQELRQLVIDHDEGLLLLWPIGPQRILALLTSRSVDQTQMRQFVQMNARWLSGEGS